MMIALLSGLLLTYLGQIDLLRRFELITYDLRMREAPVAAPPEILVVAIDERSIQQFQAWPWPRSTHARLIDRLRAAGAKLIAFDVVFAGPSGGGATFDKEVPLEQWGKSTSPEDKALTRAMKRAGNVILAATLPEGDDQSQDSEQGSLQAPEMPYDEFQEAALAVAPANVVRDPDNVVRHYWLTLNHLDETYPSLAVSIASHIQGVSDQEVIKGAAAQAGSDAPANQMLLWFSPLETAAGGFEVVSYYDVYKGLVPAERIKGRIVVVGGTAPVLQDLWQTPMLSGARTEGGAQKVALVPGVVVQATAVANLLQQRHPVPVTWPTKLVVALVACLLVALALVFLRPLTVLALVMVPVSALVLVFGAWALNAHHLWMPVAVPVLAAWVTCLGGTTYRYMAEEAGKRRLRRAWQKRVSPEVLQLILRDPTMTQVEAREVTATVLFSDLRGFTTLSALHSPQELVQVLNHYLTRMTAVILRHGGTINKFLGDGIMAVFGDPVPRPDHALRAATAALEMQEELARLREESEGGSDVYKSLFMRVGLHTGTMLAGDVGSEDMLEYTVIGDTVNTASRLESLGKEYGTQVLMSADTWEQVRDRVQARFLGEVTLRNRPQPIGVYELVGLTGQGQAPEQEAAREVQEHSQTDSSESAPSREVGR